MGLITRKIWVEGPDGEQVEREYFEREEVTNPYAGGKTARQLRADKARQFMWRKIRPDEKGYTWSMGYNHCCGRYSTGGSYSRFSGSSLNRKKKIVNEEVMPEKPSLQDATRYLLSMARKVQAKCAGSGGKLPGPLITMVQRGDAESREEFRAWVSEQIGRNVVPVSYGVHMLSARSRGKIKDKATAFFRASTGDRVFCTLTFVAAVDDQTGVAILNKYLTALRKKFKNIQYLWVAERQDNNVDFPGNIHFHIILNKRLPIRRWNAMWVLQQYNAGLVGNNKYDERISKDEILERFDADTIHKVFNPVDVKKVKSIAGLSLYLTKYITKQKKNEPFGCAVWHCSRRVSRIFTRATVGPSAFRYMQSFNNYKVDMDTGECFKPNVIRGDFFVMVYANNKAAPLNYLREMEQVNKWILSGHEMDWLPEIDDARYRSKFCNT